MSSQVVVLGPGQFTPVELVQIAWKQYRVALDPAAVSKLKEVSSSDETSLFSESATSIQQGSELPAKLTRGVLAACARMLLQEGIGTSQNAVKFLADSLNSNTLPTLCLNSLSADILRFLLDNNVALSKGDTAAIWRGSFSVAALSAIVAVGLRSAAYIADLATALSYEAMKGDPSIFDPKYTDVARPQCGQVLSSTTLRLLLEDSTECQRGKLPAGFGNDALDCAHQIHGPLYESSLEFERAAKVELNAVPFEKSGTDNSEHKGLFHAFPFSSVAVWASKALGAVVSGVDQRTSVLGSCTNFGKIACDLTELSSGEVCDWENRGYPNSLEALFQFYSLLESCHEAFSQEISIDDHLLAQREAEVQERQKQKTQARKQREKEQAEKEKEDLEKKLAACSTEEEKEKVREREKKAAEKRAEKARKAAEKAAKKTSAGALLGLGAGTRRLRAMLYEVAAQQDPKRAEEDENGFTPVIELPVNVLHRGLNFWNPEIAETEKPIFDKIERILDEISSGGARRRPKIPKGTRDFSPEQMEVREKAFSIIKNVFQRHGAVQIDTPVFECRETLLGKYGEEGGKLIYDLADQGGEALCLRYDLTVPFARYVAMNKIQTIKRYHISKVYRRDQPNITKGRYREFYQCDLDIAGASSIPMLPDAEVIKVACEILNQLPIGSFEIKLNHRGLLDAMLEIAGVPSHKFKVICSSIDKLDKESWDTVRHEMIVDKGLSESVADQVGDMVLRAGEPQDLLAELQSSASFCSTHQGARKSLDELSQLFTFLNDMGVLKQTHFDLSLARGLDYYTGVIYEAVLTDPSVAVGSIAAGGRYDNLVGMFSTSGENIPCVGVSIGIERIFAIMEEEAKKKGGYKTTPVNVLVASAGTEAHLTSHRVQICSELWDAGISAKTFYHASPKMDKQLKQALSEEIPFMVIVGESEVEAGTVNVKNLDEKTEEVVSRKELPEYLRKCTCALS
eukprot:gb/GECG01001440.1/.p1 GENE.gb/GECG01001440.1/~~gb/GECG01001440.1/.p1  ORF type:complete len:968 (+),score=135.35 gb/GECG01001440.1/:1-2904(+)